MIYTSKGGDSPAGVTAQHNNATASKRTSTVYGVLALHISDLSMSPAVPTGVRVRVHLGREGWFDASILQRLAHLTWPARFVEVEGDDTNAIREVVQYLDRARARQDVAEAAHVEHMARWGLGGAA